MFSDASKINQRLILCIAPTAEICVLLEMMLPEKKLKVRYAAKMEEAAKLLKFEHPALIIIENSFAENEIGSHISAVKMEAPGSKIIMVSSIGEEAATKACRAGVDIFLERPFNKARLVEAVSSMLV
jgi:DNA-binding NtrC family response regulator